MEGARLQLAKFMAAAAVSVGLLAAGLLTNERSIRAICIGFLLFLAAPILVLVWKDTGQALLQAGRSSTRAHFWGRVFAYPQAVLGLVCATIAIFIFGLVLYRWWADGVMPHLRWLSTPPSLLAIGLYLMRDALRLVKTPEPGARGKAR
jgi:hypothetical protein